MTLDGFKHPLFGVKYKQDHHISKNSLWTLDHFKSLESGVAQGVCSSAEDFLIIYITHLSYFIWKDQAMKLHL